LPEDAQIGVGVVNQTTQESEAVDEVSARIAYAISLFGRDQLLLHPNCGFAIVADNPICCTDTAEATLTAIARAAERFP
jgi:5-methyltetrahydropteroyltriglutamate--homocysteine methyltransferase